MSRYKKHVIVYGDTPQNIAEKEIGDVSKWVDLVKANNLVYPYIVDTPKDKQQNIAHLVTLGDTIIIPVETTLGDIDPDSLSKLDQSEVSNIVLGKDISATNFPAFYNKYGADDETLQLTGNGKGDLASVSGYQNIKQVLILHLLTPKGSLPLHPDYGSGLQSLFSKNIEVNRVTIDAEISKCILSDSRVANCVTTDSYYTGDSYWSEWGVSLISFDEQFNMLVKKDSQNNFTIV